MLMNNKTSTRDQMDESENYKHHGSVKPSGNQRLREMERDLSVVKILLGVLCGSVIFLLSGGVSDFILFNDRSTVFGSLMEYDWHRYRTVPAGMLMQSTALACTDVAECNDLPTDDDMHPWRWARAQKETLDRSHSHFVDCKGDQYTDLYNQFHTQGYVIFQSCLQDYSQLDGRDSEIIDFLEYLHGGVPTEVMEPTSLRDSHRRYLHSEAMFADTFPRTRMTSIWIAKEDLKGSIPVVPHSHHAAFLDYNPRGQYGTKQREERIVALKQGQIIVWASPTLHGRATLASDQSNLSSFNYYFEGAKNYWSPMYSKLDQNKVFFKIKPIHSTHEDGEQLEEAESA